MPESLLFVALSLGCYRLSRLFNRDTWPPMEWLRNRFGEDSYWGEFIRCPWCAGTVLSVASVYLFHRYVMYLTPHWAVWAGGIACVVGFLGFIDDRLSE